MAVCTVIKLKQSRSRFAMQLARGTMVALTLMSVVACGNKEKAAAGQSLARVNGKEITVHQINEELARANVPPEQRDAATKQLLEGLIDRQLLEIEATHDKVDRDPAVVQAIERAKSQIVAQAYMQKRLVKVGKPTKEEIAKYYADHPEFFAERKLFELDQLIFSSKDFSSDLKAAVGPNKTIDDVATWMKEHHIQFVKNQATRSTVDLPLPLTKKLKEMKKGQLFALQEGDKSIFVVIANVKDSPVSMEIAEPQIGQFLFNQRNKEAADAEMARLRASAKIEYLNKKIADAKDAPSTASPKKDEKSTDDHVKRGAAGL